MRSLLIQAIVFAIFLSNLSAKQIYVSTSGSDANTGVTPEQALASVAAALNHAKPGDEIRLLPGIYLGTQKIWSADGAPEFPITIMSDADNSSQFAIIDGGAPAALDRYKYGLWFDNASWIVVKNLKFQNCWTDVVVMERVSYISFIGCQFKGGRRVIYPKGNNCHHFLVENCYWEQDERVYTTFSWDEMHHGSLAYYNGSLFGAKGIGGGFVIRNNVIKNVFNGIRFTGDKNNSRQNGNGEIYGNTIINSRDNALEPEDVCSNLHCYHNTFINSHAHISIDMIRGGPIYFYGNIGYQTEDRGHEWTIFKFRGYEAGKTAAPLDEPFYVFNNSWFVHFDAFGGSSSQYRNHHLRHFNNAYFFSQSGDLGLQFWGEDYELDFDCSNVEFPYLITFEGQEANGLVADPLFADQENGDFRLAEGSPCIDAGMVMNFPEFEWSQLFQGLAPDIGAFEGDSRVEGPPFQFKQPPGGSYYVEKPRIVRHKISGDQLVLYWSIELDPVSVTRPSIHLYQDSSLISVADVSFPNTDYELQITAGKELDEARLSLRFDPLPLGKNGETATHWAATIPMARDDAISAVRASEPINPGNELKLSIYPNPLNDSGIISIDRSFFKTESPKKIMELSILIYNIQGKLVARLPGDCSEQDFVFPLKASQLTSGVYFALINFDRRRAVTKFLILK